MDWFEAHRTCAKTRADLVVPNSRSEWFFWELFQKECDPTLTSHLRIGCNYIKEEGKRQDCPFKGATNAYEKWVKEEPNDWHNQEDCGVEDKDVLVNGTTTCATSTTSSLSAMSGYAT